MAQDERLPHRDVPDAHILVGVQIAAADSRRLHAQEHLAASRRTGPRHLFQPQIRRAVQSRRQHRSGSLTTTRGRFLCAHHVDSFLSNFSRHCVCQGGQDNTKPSLFASAAPAAIRISGGRR